MRKVIWKSTVAASLLIMTIAVPAQASHADGHTSGKADSLPAENLVKRTWHFTKRYGIINLGGRGGCGVEAEEALARIEEANRLLADFLAGPGDPKKLNLERKRYLAQVIGAQRSIETYLATFNAVGQRSPDGYVPSVDQDICIAKGQRVSILALRDGLVGMGKVYPDMTEVGPVLAQAQMALNAMGDDKSIAAMVLRNREGSLESVRLKPALSSNPDWIEGFRSAFASLIPGEVIVKVHPYSSDWYVHKNAATSYPEYRQIGAWIAARRPDGTCWIHSIDLWQNYTGKGFDRGEYKRGDPPQQILCENIK